MFAGLGTSSWKKTDSANQRLAAVGFQKTVFATKAVGGETGINLASLTVPPEMTAQGFTNPSTATLLGAQLLFYSRNLTLWSSVHGRMSNTFQYKVASSGQINFLGFTALAGEIFEGTIDYNALPNVQVVAAVSPPATGTVAAGTTDFNVGFPFTVGLNITTQIGAVRVTKNGQLLLRNTNNTSAAQVLSGAATGDYQEVDSGSGLGQIIRLNKIDPDNAATLAVEPTGRLVEMPNGSMMAVIETIQGQINTMSTYVGALAGVSSTTVVAGAATTVALQTFGNAVISLQQNAALINVSNVWTVPQAIPANTTGTAPAAGYPGEQIKATSTSLFDQTSPANNTYYDVSGLSILLTPGIWDIHVLNMMAAASNNASSAPYCTQVTGLRDAANNLIQDAASIGGCGPNTNTGEALPYASHYLTARVTISTSTTYKVSIKWVNQSGSPTITDLYSRGDLLAAGCYILGRRVGQ